jgi:hypothetical protein
VIADQCLSNGEASDHLCLPESLRKHGGRAAEAAEIDAILEFCGFAVQADRISIAQDGLKLLADMQSLTEKDVAGALGCKGICRKDRGSARKDCLVFG